MGRRVGFLSNRGEIVSSVDVPSAADLALLELRDGNFGSRLLRSRVLVPGLVVGGLLRYRLSRRGGVGRVGTTSLDLRCFVRFRGED